jgi:CBS domain-containing protein
MKVRDVMTTDVVTVQADAPLRQVAELLVQHRVSGLPVCDAEGGVIGVVSEHDLLFRESGAIPRPDGFFWWLADERDYAELAKPEARTAREAMTEPAITITGDRPIAAAARLMVERRVNRLPVLDGNDLVGIVTRADLVRVLTRSDEELQREIVDDVLRRTLWLGSDEVEVEVADGAVTVRGVVDSEADAELVERLVARVPGVVSVACLLEVRSVTA